MANSLVPGALLADFHQIVATTEEGGQRVIKEAAEHGARVMRDTIEIAGTGNEWSGEFGSFPHGHPGRGASDPGRVASGTMLDAVGSRLIDKATAEFGWTQEQIEYFLYQEYGWTNHNLTGNPVQGMFAMQDAFDEVKQWMDYEMRKMLREGSNW